MGRYDDLFQRLERAVLDGRGETPPALRQAVAARTAELGGRPKDAASPASGEPIPADLRGFVDTIGRHAYRVTDEDVEALLRAGYSEDVIFEVSISAALGAGQARLERGLAALRGGQR